MTLRHFGHFELHRQGLPGKGSAVREIRIGCPTTGYLNSGVGRAESVQAYPAFAITWRSCSFLRRRSIIRAPSRNIAARTACEDCPSNQSVGKRRGSSRLGRLALPGFVSGHLDMRVGRAREDGSASYISTPNNSALVAEVKWRGGGQGEQAAAKELEIIALRDSFERCHALLVIRFRQRNR